MNLRKKFGFASTLLSAFLMFNFSCPSVCKAENVPSLENRILNYIQSNAVPGKKFLVDKVRENRITLLGENHAKPRDFDKPVYFQDDAELVAEDERMLIESMPELKKAGLKYLAMEWSEETGSSIEEYIRTGVKSDYILRLEDSLICKGLLDSHAEIIKTAKDNGLEVVYMDASIGVPVQIAVKMLGMTRDEYMAEKVKEVLHKDKDARLLIYVGAAHVIEEGITALFKKYLGEGSLGMILEREFDPYCIVAETVPEFANLPYGAYGLSDKIVAVEVDGTPLEELGEFEYYKNYGTAFDGVIIFPSDR